MPGDRILANMIAKKVVALDLHWLIRGILKQAEKKGYLVIILQSNESMKLEKEQVNLLLQKGVDGILISLSNSTTDFSHLYKVQAYGKPLVLFYKIEKTLNCSKVIIDDRLDGYKATEHLIKNGRKKIAHFRQVGYKFDRWIDVGYWELIF